jgi:hypothetical protein
MRSAAMNMIDAYFFVKCGRFGVQGRTEKHGKSPIPVKAIDD